MKTLETLKGFLFIFIYLYLPSLIAVPILLLFNDTNNTAKSIILLISQILVTLLIIKIFYKELKKDFTNFKNNYKKQLSNSVIYYIIGFIAMIVINSIVISLFTNDISANETSVREAINSLMIYAIPTTALLAPICEEIVFRKSFAKSFNKEITYVLFTGILFGFAHVSTTGISLETLLTLLPYASLGIAFSYMYIKNKNIFPCIFYHIIHNTFTLLLILSI